MSSQQNNNQQNQSQNQRSVPLPPSDFNTRALSLRSVDPATLMRIGSDKWPATNFRAGGTNRFDAPDKSYKTLYAAVKFEVCFVETMLRDNLEDPLGPGNIILVPQARLEKNKVIQLSGELLNLAEFCGWSLKLLGADGQISTAMDYSKTQKWSKAIHDHPRQVDGMIYMGRNLNTEEAVVIFERAAHKLNGVFGETVFWHPEFLALARKYHIAV